MTKDKPTEKVGGTIQVCSICHQPTRLFEADHEECMNKDNKPTTRAEINKQLEQLLLPLTPNKKFDPKTGLYVDVLMLKDVNREILEESHFRIVNNYLKPGLEKIIAAAVREERGNILLQLMILKGFYGDGTGNDSPFIPWKAIINIFREKMKEETEGEGEVE